MELLKEEQIKEFKQAFGLFDKGKQCFLKNLALGCYLIDNLTPAVIRGVAFNPEDNKTRANTGHAVLRNTSGSPQIRGRNG